MKELKFKTGDSVLVNGTFYQSANGTLKGSEIKNLKTHIKRVAPTAAHPYAIEGLWGWFDENCVNTYIEPPVVNVGDQIKLIKNETYRHTQIRLSPNIIYTVEEINDDKVTISFQSSKAIVSIYNLKVIETPKDEETGENIE